MSFIMPAPEVVTKKHSLNNIYGRVFSPKSRRLEGGGHLVVREKVTSPRSPPNWDELSNSFVKKHKHGKHLCDYVDKRFDGYLKPD